MSTMTLISPTEANALPHDDAHRNLTWMDVTSEAAKELLEERYQVHLAKADSQTSAQKDKARAAARVDVLNWNYKLVEFNGYRNPIQDDDVWGPNSQDSQPEAKEDFKPNRYGGKCASCNVWVEEQKGKLVKVDGKWGAEHITCPDIKTPEVSTEPTTSAPMSGLDLTELPSGYYAVPGGDTRLKLRISRGKDGSKWGGYIFVTDGAEYGQQKRYGMQRPGQSYSGQVMAELEAIVADPKGAMAAYGHLVGRCGRCNRVLEDETSIANGIGPICAEMF